MKKRNDSKQTNLSLEDIKKYLRGEITDQQKEQYNDHFSHCQLSNAVKNSHATINQLGVEEDIDELKSAIFATASKRDLANRRLFLSRIAAGILLPITAIASFLFWKQNAESRLFATHFESYELPETDTRSGDGIVTYDAIDMPKDLRIALEKYQQKDYQGSITAFEDYQKFQPQNTYANFLFALANLEIGNVAMASNVLETVRINDPIQYADATWYLALAKIKQKKIEEAILLLKELENYQQVYYRKKAVALLKELDK
ncbi:MAG: hypothetical protein AAF960_13765 [Bacteroidota bacterium]